MSTDSGADNREKLFDELIAVKLLHKEKVQEIKSQKLKPEERKSLEKELHELEKKIKSIQNAIARFGESFLDVYDEELIKPLSESDIIFLREEIREVRGWLQSIKTP